MSSQSPRFKRGDKNKYKVDPLTGCWIWLGAVNPWGYGVVRDDKGKVVLAHCYFYVKKYGPVPEGKELGHDPDICGLRICCNPDHVRPIPHVINMWERVATKLDEIVAAQILDDLEHSVPINEIEKKYLVSRAQINHVRTGSTWKHVRSTSEMLNDELDAKEDRESMEEDDDPPF